MNLISGRYALVMVVLFLVPPLGVVVWPDCVPCSALMSRDMFYLLYIAGVGVLVGSIAGYSHAKNKRHSGTDHD
jgi:hypothetical protein